MSKPSRGVWFGCALLCGAAALATARAAEAQAPQEETRRATQLFDEGKALLEAKRYGEACIKLAESDKLDPSVGTMGLLAACHERKGELATAYRAYQKTVERARIAADRRVDYARERALALEPRVPVITLTRTGDRAGETITLDGTDTSGETRLLVDPGTHTLSAKAPGKKAWSVELRMAEGDKRAVVVPMLESATPPATGRASPTQPSDASRPDRSRMAAPGASPLTRCWGSGRRAPSPPGSPAPWCSSGAGWSRRTALATSATRLKRTKLPRKARH